jgi:hypothetical protein
MAWPFIILAKCLQKVLQVLKKSICTKVHVRRVCCVLVCVCVGGGGQRTLMYLVGVPYNNHKNAPTVHFLPVFLPIF